MRSREMLLAEIARALRDAFEARQRNAGGDYGHDTRAERFPSFDRVQSPPSSTSPKKVSLTGILDGWWKEAQTTGRKPSTYEGYSNTLAALIAFLKHDDAAKVRAEDIIAFKDHRLALINPRTGKRISAKTVKDSDLAGLKTLFGWAVSNRKLIANPVTGITIKLGKPQRLRGKVPLRRKLKRR